MGQSKAIPQMVLFIVLMSIGAYAKGHTIKGSAS